MGRHAPISQTEPKTPAPLAALNAALAALPSSAELHPLERLAGALSRTISPTGRDLTAAVIRTLQTGALASDDLERARHALTRPTAAALPEPVRRSLLAAIERAFHRPPPQQRRRPALDLRFSAADELYIDDAGLVLLWPFLGHFFQYLGLTTARSFRDDLARQRAAALLRVVTTGAAVVAEYQLPLAKLLCGLELDAVVDPGDAPSPAEVEECERLLDAVIARAEILKKMSTAGFRGTFLLREGSLSRRDGAWLLRVERRSYDLVLDRFPWGREWVKLPWMVTAIRVEW